MGNIYDFTEKIKDIIEKMEHGIECGMGDRPAMPAWLAGQILFV